MSVFRLQEIDPELLERERARWFSALRRVLPEWARVHEVGSTAVHGAIGKGDLDFLVRVPAERFEDACALVASVGTWNPAQLTTPCYRGYTLPAELDAAVQLTVRGSEHDTFLRFLEALRNDAALLERYNTLKRAHDGAPMVVYRAAKSAFIEDVLTREKSAFTES